MSDSPSKRIAWLSDLVTLEITLWNRVDARLRDEHGLPLALFWPLYVVGQSSGESLRVGEVAEAIGLTVGGASKIVDRIVRAGFLRRESDPTDRRASRVLLTETGRQILDAASQTYEAEMADLLDSALSPKQQELMHRLVRSVLDVARSGESV